MLKFELMSVTYLIAWFMVIAKDQPKNCLHRDTIIIVMMNYRHGLDFKFAAFVTNGSEATIWRISWLVYLPRLFNKLDTQKFLLHKMPRALILYALLLSEYMLKYIFLVMYAIG